ncbi:serine/threonine-protein kinase TBK1-like [Patiria miniata]|uniref:IkappaB kinase n=1 Tax=Patiria miniata TaxID=46514 RepID=A0A914AU54_PATMI|nr:serine/threonine-protein kinase TBK1-like [Patiria miniata]XP_038067209.1 serine/threonine-protein kinase TBK1-like [Patiria miniata]
MAASSQIRSTKSYLWYLNDVLGTGATSTVYRGRHKKTGELVAAKAFNSLSFMRPQSVQQREFDVLLKLSHRNIVKLFDIEQDQISKNPVIIMELCSGGSLYSLLEDPKNSYGMEEAEFKRVLGDVCAGMKHLRDLDIVHRDIKPGNIMIVTGDDGSSVYKLADFGAARELQDDENFMSLYGTEEYLHPDLYERAVLRQPTGKTFSARIDLWSIGITFYHVATGVLPFRPFGGRKNRETMFHITTKKKSGVISGVQKDSMNGPIEWSSELPNTCRLSRGLKILLTKILRGLLECNPERMWTFNQFFDEVQVLLAMKVVDLFHVSKSECLKIYAEPRGTLAEFQEAIAEQTGVQATTQALVWDRDCFCPDASLKCESYPETTPQNPVILLEVGRSDFPRVETPSQPKLPKMSSTYDLDKDANMAKMSVAVLYYMLAWLQNLTFMQELMTTVSKAIVCVLKAEVRQLDYHCVKLHASIVEVDTRLLCVEQTLPSPLVSASVFSRIPDQDSLGVRLQSIQDIVTRIRIKVAPMVNSYDGVKKKLESLMKYLIVENQLTKKWAASEEALKPCYVCLKRFAIFTEEAHKIYTQFKKEKQKKHLSYNEEQIHKMDKEKLNLKSTQAMSICQSHCDLRWKTIHAKLSEWYIIAHQFRQQVRAVDKTLSQLVRDYQVLLQEVHMLDTDVQPPVTEFEETLQDSLMAFGATPKTPRRPVDVGTNTDPFTPLSGLAQSDPKVLEQEVTPEQIASISEQLAGLPMDSNGYILVPKDVKAMFEAWEQEIDLVSVQMESGRQKMEAMQQMSLSMEQEGICPRCGHLSLTGDRAREDQRQRLPSEGSSQLGSQPTPVVGYQNMVAETHRRMSRDAAPYTTDRTPVASAYQFMPEPSQRLPHGDASQFNTPAPVVYMPDPSWPLPHEGASQLSDQATVVSGFQYMPEPSQRSSLEEASQFKNQTPDSGYQFMPEPSQRLTNKGTSQFGRQSPQLANGE